MEVDEEVAERCRDIGKMLSFICKIVIAALIFTYIFWNAPFGLM